LACDAGVKKLSDQPGPYRQQRVIAAKATAAGSPCFSPRAAVIVHEALPGLGAAAAARTAGDANGKTAGASADGNSPRCKRKLANLDLTSSAGDWRLAWPAW